MSRTVFSDGSYLTANFASSIFTHDHSGVDSDGHAPKVILTNAAEVQGILPLANIVKIPLDTAGVTGYLSTAQVTGLDFVNRSTAQGVTGLKTFNSGITLSGTAGMNLTSVTPSFSFQWYPVTIGTGTLPANSYLYGWRCATLGDGTGGSQYFYVGQFDSSTTQSGGIPNSAFNWPLSDAVATWEITANDSSNGIEYMRLTNILNAGGWGGVINYQAIAQPSTNGAGYQTGASNNFLALGSDTSSLWLWYKTSGAGDRMVKFSMRITMVGSDFA